MLVCLGVSVCEHASRVYISMRNSSRVEKIKRVQQLEAKLGHLIVAHQQYEMLFFIRTILFDEGVQGGG